MQSILQTYLREQNILPAETLQNAIKTASIHNQTLLHFLAKEQLLKPDVLAQITAKLLNFPITDISTIDIQEDLVKSISPELMHDFYILPLRKHQAQLDLAMVDPTDLSTIETIKFYSGLSITPHLVRYDQLRLHLEKIKAHQTIQQLNASTLDIKNHAPDVWNTLEENNEPLVHFINHLIEKATHKNVSDIHIEPDENQCRIRLRQDGVLHEMITLPPTIAKRLAIRFKIMAKMDIAEQRHPQDGQYKIQLKQQSIDIRTSTCPTLYGEKIVLRLLNHDNKLKNIQQLGLSPAEQKILLNAIHQPQGLILVTGPTGSGKTSTLYAILDHLHSSEKNIITVEDPVEIRLPGINQVNIQTKADLTFSHILRAILRQDPDIILIGEIRDTETAEIAIKAAQTGHLVLSTLHTNHAHEAFIRLAHLGINPYHAILETTLITSQRLIRKLCPICKKEEDFPLSLINKLGLSKNATLFQAIGCKQCTKGYNGRIAIHEMLPVNEDILKNVSFQNDLSTLLDLTQQQVTCNLQQSAIAKIESGETSPDEIYRVIGWQELQKTC